MLKMVGGEPPHQILVLGLSFGNLANFQAHPSDTYIHIKKEDTGLPIDVLIASGMPFRARGRLERREAFIISLDMDDLRKLRQNPGSYIIDLDQQSYELPMNIVIFSGETEAEMATQCQELIGPKTRVTIDQRLKN